MVLGFVLGVAIAYLLTFFHIDQTIISGVKDLIKMDIGQSGYYFLFGVIGGVSRVMIGGFISGLIVAFLFTLLNLDHIVIDGLKEWFKYDMTTGGYYLVFALLGAALSFLKIIRMCLKPLFFLTKKSSAK
ncbi:hypothetical protein [Anaerospora sp.]|jgi:hypothetical protein|uniref:hypothetical protein n=1 Tax=Anaerospora sp. TaxID=1960278 RepID=UPI0028A1C5F0|nr:hypothetical protein [Anaerospora sp.]